MCPACRPIPPLSSPVRAHSCLDRLISFLLQEHERRESLFPLVPREIVLHYRTEHVHVVHLRQFLCHSGFPSLLEFLYSRADSIRDEHDSQGIFVPVCLWDGLCVAEIFSPEEANSIANGGASLASSCLAPTAHHQSVVVVLMISPLVLASRSAHSLIFLFLVFVVS